MSIKSSALERVKKNNNNNNIMIYGGLFISSVRLILSPSLSRSPGVFFCMIPFESDFILSLCIYTTHFGIGFCAKRFLKNDRF